MEHVLVTGGAGFVGSHVVHALVQRKVRARVLALPHESLVNLGDLDVEVVRADVRDAASLRRAVDGVDTVVHAAAIYESYAPDPTRMYDVNLLGTVNVMEAAREAGVAKVIYTASIVALGRPQPGTLADESTPYEAWDLDFAYSRSKYLSKRIAESYRAWGLDVRIICPGIVLGPGDRTPTPSGRIILGIAAGKAPGWVEGGASYVDVRDVALAHVRAAEREERNGTWIATGHNLSNRALLDIVCRVCGMRPRTVKIPVPLARAYVRAREAIAVRRGQTPDLASTFFDYGLRDCFYDNTAAVTQLGIRFRPIDETIRDALAWFRDEGIA